VDSSSGFSIALALVVSREVLLMDEPASAQDPVSTAKIEDLMLPGWPNFTGFLLMAT
jgi:phosphate transport system ATP-binding protein